MINTHYYMRNMKMNLSESTHSVIDAKHHYINVEEFSYLKIIINENRNGSTC